MPTRRADTDSRAGDLIGERYRLAERIGKGGMAAVYRAHDEQLDRAVAVKVMRADLGEDPLFVQRFEAEARRAASVSHPNVVSVYDVGTDGAPYMVMELIEGGDLASLLKRDGRMAPERAARLCADAAAALQAAHDAGLVHRDVKPGNILLRADGRAMVADFGIARATGEDSMTKTGAMLGSVEYFSPEQARGERAGPASDIYALGVVLYELLTGQRAFHGDSAYAVATARLREPVPDPRRVVPELPAELARMVTRAMAREPAQRFASADALRSALLEWVDGPGRQAPIATALPGPSVTPAATATVGGSDPGERDPRRRRVAPAWALAILLVALVGGGYLGGRLITGGGETGALPGVIVGSPGGVVIIPTPTASPPSATPTPTTRPTPSAQPPTPPPTPAPVATPAPPTPAPVAAVAPDDTVAAFYGHVEGGRFDQAYALWSDRMKDAYPRQDNLDDRFASTADISFETLEVAEQTATAATVQANFIETYDSGSSRRFVGYWRLIRVDGRWLLDEPTY
ncbi:MAG: serine/threonine protein kinase [Chloroflexi bacterium]|nr:serine/threonine protein kinase [Chloroflexota bacterium]